MEKIVYPVWMPAGLDQNTFRQGLLQDFRDRVLALPSVLALKVCIVDEHVAAAAPYRMVNLFESAFDGVVMIWVDAATDLGGLEAVFRDYFSSYHGYLVTESEQIPPSNAPITPGEKTTGMNEIVFLRKPERLDYSDWLSIWQDSHTAIAIDTQSTFGYRQNVVIRGLTAGAPSIDAIIEENFPDKAIFSRAAFYDAEHDQALYQSREQTMIESCARFIDFDKLDCIPTSEYILKQLGK